eukprot:m.339275 g.339275  ORF g.339275 m.339275 type:complete len:326 (+) comp18732_c0_seq1:184-1161(+)
MANTPGPLRLHVKAPSLNFTMIVSGELKVKEFCESISHKYQELCGKELEIPSITNAEGFLQDPSYALKSLFVTDSCVLVSDHVITGNKSRKRPRSALERFKVEKTANYKEEFPGKSKQEALKLATEMWNGMAEGEKKKYMDEAQAEMDDYRHDHPVAKRPKKERDPNAPKKPLTSFLIFCEEKRKTITGVRGAGVMKVLGEEWRKLTQTEKKKFETESARLKELYEKELEIYNLKKNLSQSTPNQNPKKDDGADEGNTQTPAAKKKKKGKLLESLAKNTGPLSIKKNRDKLKKAYIKEVGAENTDDDWLKRRIEKIQNAESSASA